jgi:glycogen debranching enzyme
VQDVLLQPRFWDAVPLPSVALDDPTHTSRDHYWGLRRYWRGPSWVNAAWFAWMGLQRLDYHAEADDLRDRLVAVVLREGLREYYDARTGEGMGAVDFGWSSLVWEMVDPLD